MTSAKVAEIRAHDAARKREPVYRFVASVSMALGEWRTRLSSETRTLPRSEARRFLFDKQAETFMRQERTRLRVQARQRKRRGK